MPYGFDASGYSAPRSADLLVRIREEVEAELLARSLPADVDWERDTVWGGLTAVIATVLGDLSEGTQAIYDARDPGNAQNTSLDSLSAIVGTQREAATFSQGTFKLDGTNGTVVTAGSLIEGGGPDGVSQWELLADTTIGATPTDAIFRAVDAGDIRVEAGTLEIVTPIAGWDEVYCVAAVFGGAAQELDSALRIRREESLQVSGSNSVNALRAQLEALSFVTAAVVIDNPTDADATIGGLTVTRRALAAVVYPSGLTLAQEQEIAQLIYDNQTAGVTADGTESFTVTGLDGFSKSVKFSYASGVNVNVNVTLTLASGYSLGSVTTAVTEAIQAYFDSLSVGDAVRILKILGAIDLIQGINGASVLLNGGSSDIVPTIVEYPNLGTLVIA